MIIVIMDNDTPIDAFYSPEPNTSCEKVIKVDKDSLVAKVFMMKAGR